MDDLDRQIVAAATEARRLQRQRRMAMAGALAAFFATCAVVGPLLFLLAPMEARSALERREAERKARGEPLDMVGVAENFAATQVDDGRGQWQVMVTVLVSFYAAIYTLRRLEPSEDS